MLFNQHSSCKPQERFGVGEDAGDVGAVFDFLVDAF